jgi:hypothetical protein
MEDWMSGEMSSSGEKKPGDETTSSEGPQSPTTEEQLAYFEGLVGHIEDLMPYLVMEYKQLTEMLQTMPQVMEQHAMMGLTLSYLGSLRTQASDLLEAVKEPGQGEKWGLVGPDGKPLNNAKRRRQKKHSVEVQA